MDNLAQTDIKIVYHMFRRFLKFSINPRLDHAKNTGTEIIKNIKFFCFIQRSECNLFIDIGSAHIGDTMKKIRTIFILEQRTTGQLSS